MGRQVWNFRKLCVRRKVWIFRVLCVGDRCGFVGYCVWEKGVVF